MSDNFIDKNNAILTRHSSATSTTSTSAAIIGHQQQFGGAGATNSKKQQQQQQLQELAEGGIVSVVSDDEIQIQYDHMYATNHSDHNHLLQQQQLQHNGGLLLSDESTQQACYQQQQATKSEVNFIKDFLLIHLDLIQRQNDDILNKENSIFQLQQENLQLREQIKSLEAQLAARVVVVPTPSELAAPVGTTVDVCDAESSEDMVIDSTTLVVEHIEASSAPHVVVVQPAPHLAAGIPEESDEAAAGCEREVVAPAEPQPPEESDSSAAGVTVSAAPATTPLTNAELPDDDADDCDYEAHSSYTIHHSSAGTAGDDGSDPMKNLKMSIRRKRLCSNSSATVGIALTGSNGASTTPTTLVLADDKKSFKQQQQEEEFLTPVRNKRRRLVKHEELLTHAEQYFTQVGDGHLLDIIRRQELAEEVAKAADSSSLEVPRWRVKVYTSCYTMEGTENLDDEVFLRRHARMENDEKRRKRWDVQRIREQRVIEKLKQRQDKIDANCKNVNTNEEPEPLMSLWPAPDDVKFIEMCSDLPVAAFGVPIPKLEPSIFSLPWLANLNLKKILRRTGATPAANRRRRRNSKR